MLHAGLQAIAGIILQPVITLAAIAFLFGGSDYQIAAFAVIAVASWALAPVVTLLLGSAVRDTYPVVLAASVLRFAAVVVIGFIGFRIDNISPGRVVGSLVFAYLVYQIASAIAGQSTSTMILGGIERNRQTSFFRRRGYAAVGFALIGAVACWSVFRSGEPFQRSVGLLLMLAAISLGSATWFLLNATRRAGRTQGIPLQQLMGSIRDALRRAPFRRYAAFKILLALTAAFDPFVLVYGFQELGLGVTYIGWAILAFAAGHLAGYALWGQLIARHSPRVPFQIATFLRLLFLTWIVAVPTLAASTWYTDRFDDIDAAMGGFALGFVLIGLAASVGTSANQRYLMDIAPRGTLQGQILATNVIAGIFAFSPFGVAWLMQRYDLERLMWAGVGVSIVALLASGLLHESRARIRTPSGTWRSRRRTPRTA
jgi:hypothetical protein